MDADMFRIGTTSYIIPADILPNVEYLAPLVDDVQLVLFETDEHGSNLPDATLRQRLADLAAQYGITYTVHLPLDLRLGDTNGMDLLPRMLAARPGLADAPGRNPRSLSIAAISE